MTAESRDPALEALLAERTWLRGVARALVGADRADDLVQETWLSVLRRPPSGDVRSARAWLRRVLKNRARDARRSDERRVAREAAVPPPAPSAATDDVVAAFEAEQQVARALQALPEPYRRTLLLRYREDLAPAEIAAREGASEDTVRSRIRRGLALLRDALDDGTGRRLATVVAPLVGVRRVRIGSLTGGAAMASIAKTAAGAAAALAAGAALWLLWPAEGRDSRSVADARTTEASGTAGPRERARPAVGTVDLSASDGSPLLPSSKAQSGPAPIQLRGRLLAADGPVVGAASIDVRPTRMDFSWDAFDELRVTTAADGAFAVDASALVRRASPAVELSLRVDHPDYLPRDGVAVVVTRAMRREGGALAADVLLERCAVREGQVIDERGDPVAGADVGAFREHGSADAWTGVDATKTDAAGKFRLRLLPQGEQRVLAARAGLVPAAVRVRPERVDRAPLAPLTLRDGLVLAGTVVGAPETRGDNDTVHARPRSEVHVPTVTLGDLEVSVADEPSHWPARAPIATDGTFRIAGLRPGPHRVSPDLGAMHQDVAETLERDVDAGTTGVRLDVAAARIVVEATLDGAPVKDAVTWIVDEGMWQRRTDARGRLAVVVRPGATIQVTVDGDDTGTGRAEVTAPAAGEELLVPVALARPAPSPELALRLRTPDGSEIECGILELHELDGGDASGAYSTRLRRAGDGRWIARGLAAGAWRAVIRPDAFGLVGDGYFLPVEDRVELPAEGRVERAYDLAIGGRLWVSARRADGAFVQAHATLRDAQGRALRVLFADRHPSGSAGMRNCILATPCRVEPALAPGRYTLAIDEPEFRPDTRDVTIEAGKTTELDVTLAPR